MAQASDPIEQAMIETNREIAAEAWGEEAVPLDTDNDRSPETTGEGLEGQHVEDDEADELEAGEAEDGEAGEAGEGEGETKPAKEEPDKGKTESAKVEAKPDEKTEGRVPPGRLREQTERTKAAEAERDTLKTQLETERANARKEIETLNSKFDGVLTMLQRQEQPAKANGEQKTEAEAVPDMFEDPKGYAEYQDKKLTERLAPVVQSIQTQRVETSMMLAHAMHKDVFEKAITALQSLNPQNPDDRIAVQRIYASPNPGEALVSWHKRQETLREVGEDPAAYKTRIAEETRKALLADPEFRKQVIADLRAEAGNGPNGKPRTITDLPPSLANANGGARAGQAAEAFDGSDQAIAESAWR